MGATTAPPVSEFALSTRQRKNNPFNRLAVPAICSVLLAYFIFHAWSGRFGIDAMREIEENRTQLEYALARLKQEHATLEARVTLLRDGTIEKDMLDEQARHMLSLLGPNEIMILR
jgi:cell division protein FtsB